jgi:NAD(P)-dependent dehydrogenase (short-subunit alcohol dehydrogenase family)
MAAAWSEASIPDLTGVTAVVTGASGGIGLQVARGLAGKDAHVALGKMELCHAMLAGGLDDKSFRQEWLNHPSKLDRSRILAILSAPTADRVFATVEDDSAIKFRGPYVDVNPADPSGAPMTPSDVGPVPAREMVETAEEAATLALRSHSYGSRPAEGQAQDSGRVESSVTEELVKVLP